MKLNRIKAFGLIAALPLAALAGPAVAHDHKDKAGHAMTAALYAPITEAEVLAAQQAWGEALTRLKARLEG